MTAPQCEVAVIVPVHNAAAFLPDCLRALAAQTFAGFCCILVDDGSTDASAALCDEAARRDGRFCALHQPQSGVAAARTAGVRRALALGARWLAFCDADDQYHPAFLAALHAAARASGLPLACCRYDTFAETPPAEAPAPQTWQVLAAPQHLDALLHDHAVDYGLWNKLYSAALLTPAMLDNGLAYNEAGQLAGVFGRAGLRVLRFCRLPLPPARRQRHPPRAAAPKHRRPAPRGRADPRRGAGPMAGAAAVRQCVLL